MFELWLPLEGLLRWRQAFLLASEIGGAFAALARYWWTRLQQFFVEWWPWRTAEEEGGSDGTPPLCLADLIRYLNLFALSIFI